jgi:hypothetical protein
MKNPILQNGSPEDTAFTQAYRKNNDHKQIFAWKMRNASEVISDSGDESELSSDPYHQLKAKSSLRNLRESETDQEYKKKKQKLDTTVSDVKTM